MIERKSETTFEVDGRETLTIRVGEVEVKISSIPQKGDPRVVIDIHYPDSARLWSQDMDANHFQNIVRTHSDKPHIVVSR